MVIILYLYPLVIITIKPHRFNYKLTFDSMYAIMVSGRRFMNIIDFYENEKGTSDIFVFLETLRTSANVSKDARIQFGQASRYIELLEINGTNLPTDIAKHLEDEIWELRPGKNRILFFHYNKDTYVLLHHFRKKTQKTPHKEIEKAKAEMNDYISRKDTTL